MNISNYLFYIIFCILSICAFDLNAQKHDYNWLIGFSYDPDIQYNNSLLTFTENSITASGKKTICNFNLSFNLTMSDKDGNFIFYSDGCKIVDSSNEIIENGDSINAGEEADIFCEYGYPNSQGGICLPTPGKKDEYDFIYYFLDAKPAFIVHPIDLLNTHIINENGKFMAISKNVSILKDTLAYSTLIACKHANGKDWWILAPEMNTNNYYRILLDKNGFSTLGKQTVGPKYDYVSDWCGQCVFSPNGKKYARVDRGNSLTIFDFDRCTGLISEPIVIPINDQNDTIVLGCGLAYSPNSRFLYVTSGLKIYQYDMDANDIPNSMEIVGNGFKDSIYTADFYMAQLAPNNKIYIASLDSGPTLHSIENPNEKGIACNVTPHKVNLYSEQQGSLPYYPNYRLGPIDTLCDPMTSIDVINYRINIEVYPNPFHNQITIETTGYNSKRRNVDILGLDGKVLKQFSMYAGQGKLSIDLNSLPASMYLIRLISDDGIKVQKLIKQ